jgi:hypothetical protein
MLSQLLRERRIQQVPTREKAAVVVGFFEPWPRAQDGTARRGMKVVATMARER